MENIQTNSLEHSPRTAIKKAAQEMAANTKDPARLTALLRKLKAYIDEIEKSVREQTLEALRESGAVQVFGVELDYSAVDNWDYSGSARWQALSEHVERWTKTRKELEAMMRNAANNPGIALVDEETGEVIPPAVRTEPTMKINSKF